MSYWLHHVDKYTIEDYCFRVLQRQKEEKQKYMKQDNDVLIRDTNKEYKIVSKNYYLYHMKESEFDTEEELIDEDDWNEEKRIKAKYAI